MPLALHILSREMKRNANMFICNAIVIAHLFPWEALRKHIQNEVDWNTRLDDRLATMNLGIGVDPWNAQWMLPRQVSPVNMTETP
jgi:hypothetical protein